jgi:Tfp pilus assembly protein PilO
MMAFHLISAANLSEHRYQLFTLKRVLEKIHRQLPS